MSRTRMFLEMAELVATESHCVSVKVGAVFVRDGHVVMSACNDTPYPFRRCAEVFPSYKAETQRDTHHDFSERFETHAEMNAIVRSARYGIPLEGCDMYVTHQPCSNCLKALCGLGIRNVFFSHPYDKCGWDKLTMKMIAECGLNVTRFEWKK